jgi:hypothetical protein
MEGVVYTPTCMILFALKQINSMLLQYNKSLDDTLTVTEMPNSRSIYMYGFICIETIQQHVFTAQ